MKKMIISSSGDKITYRNMGITYISAEHESVEKIAKVAQNFHIPVNIVDPNRADSPGLNPFVYSDPIKTGLAVSSVLKGLFIHSRPDTELAFRENEAIRMIENISILLKEMYPLEHDGLLPSQADPAAPAGKFRGPRCLPFAGPGDDRPLWGRRGRLHFLYREG